MLSPAKLYVVSPQQRRLWHAGAQTQNWRTRCCLRVEGDVDVAFASRCLTEILAETEILRTTVEDHIHGDKLQVAADAPLMQTIVCDRHGLEPEESQSLINGIWNTIVCQEEHCRTPVFSVFFVDRD